MENSASTYLKMSEKWVEEEIGRAKHYLPESTHQKIILLVGELLIKNHMQQIVEVEIY